MAILLNLLVNLNFSGQSKFIIIIIIIIILSFSCTNLIHSYIYSFIHIFIHIYIYSFIASLFREIFNSILYGQLGVQWELSRPLLSVYLTFPPCLQMYFNELQNQAIPEKQKVLLTVLKEIEEVADRALEESSRTSFSMDIAKWKRRINDSISHNHGN